MELCTVEGHPVGMLDRDQRTAKMCVFDRHVVRDRERSPAPLISGRNKTISHRSVPGRTSPRRCNNRKNAHFWSSLHRLKHALIVGAYLSLLTFPSILSAPAVRKAIMSSRASSTPKWVNPCGMGSANGAPLDHRMSDEQILNNIINQARIAQKRANNFKEDYVQKTFKTNFEENYNFYKDQEYDWLPTKSNIPKHLHEPVPGDHISNLELQPTLINVYGYLQRIAVGLEQVVWDEEDRGGPFKNEFNETYDYLGLLLCEIQTAIIEKDLPMPENVTRDIMDDQVRNQESNTSTDIRNFVIYTNYLNMLEYIVEVFEDFKKRL